MNKSHHFIKDMTNRELPADFEPGSHDVICGRGKRSFDHIGNKRFRSTIRIHLKAYSSATTRVDKSAIVSRIVNIVRSQSPGGGFVKLDISKKTWYEVGDHLAKEKVGQTLRDALHLKYQSSTKAKKRKRLTEQAQADICIKEIIYKRGHFHLSSMIDKLNNSKTSSMHDEEFIEIFTKANLAILHELNKTRNTDHICDF